MEGLDLSMLPFVRAAAQAGSFSAAAAELGFSQPAVSQRIRRFERDLGVALFLRTPDGVIPTEAGQVLLRHSLDALACMESARQEIEALRDLRSGHVRVVAFPSVSTTVLPSAIAALARDHPQVSISFQQLTPKLAVQSVIDGTADLAVTYSYDDDVDPPAQRASIETRVLIVDPLYVALSKNHRLAWRAQIDLSDLAEDDWLLGYHAEQLKRVAQQVGFVPRESHAVIDYAAASGFVAENLGIAIIPGLALMSNRHPGIVCRELLPAMNRSVNMTSRATSSKIPAVAATMSALKTAAAKVAQRSASNTLADYDDA